MIIKINKAQQTAAINKRLKSSSPYTDRCGAWGLVYGVHTADLSVDVIIDGTKLSHIPVASRTWFVEPDIEDYVTGSRNLPPIGARVFVMMPTRNFDGAFVLCSGFTLNGEKQREEFSVEEDENDNEDDPALIRHIVEPGNWKIDYRYKDGGINILSPDEQTIFSLDYSDDDAHNLYLQVFDEVKIEHKKDELINIEVFDDLKIEHKKDESINIEVFDDLKINHKKDESINIEVFDDLKIEHKKDELINIEVFDDLKINHKKEKSLTIDAFETVTSVDSDGNLTISAAGEVELTTDKKVYVKAQDVVVEAQQSASIKATQAQIEATSAKITGGMLEVSGTTVLDPTGGPFCALPNCVFTGAPHVGKKVMGT